MLTWQKTFQKMLFASIFLDSRVALLESYKFVESIIMQQAHQLRKHRFSQVIKLVHIQFLGNSNRKKLIFAGLACFIGH